jgi:hypothetical protein
LKKGLLILREGICHSIARAQRNSNNKRRVKFAPFTISAGAGPRRRPFGFDHISQSTIISAAFFFGIVGSSTEAISPSLHHHRVGSNGGTSLFLLPYHRFGLFAVVSLFRSLCFTSPIGSRQLVLVLLLL